jgi:glycine/D-amino acid oxidase-like deaminating enzyme
MAKHYDVVVLGAGIGALCTAALLARRSWRVLVLGQGFRPAHYSFDGLPLARRPFTFLASASPAWGRVLAELAQSQAFKRHGRPLDPMLQVFDPRVRLSIPPDATLLGREIDREFPEVRRVVDELYAELGQSNAMFDAAFERDVVWPPGTFWERRETARVASTIPYLEDRGRDVLAEFPRAHPYRSIVEAPARFASDLATKLPLFAVARLHGAWTRGLTELARGEADLVEFLVDRVQAHGGEAKLGSRATHVISRFGRATGVRVDGEDEVTGIQFVVTDETSSALLDLASDYRPSRRVLDARARIDVEAQRFVTSLLVRDEGIPVPLGSEVFLLPAEGSTMPAVHLQRSTAVSPVPGTTLLVAETRVGAVHPLAPESLRRARASVLAVIEAHLPFIERHYLLVDSPHDGLPLWDYRSGRRVLVDRTEVRAGGGSLDAEPMNPLFRVVDAETGTLAGVGGEAIRYPLAGTFGVGKSIVPSLGQEGELLAAWGVARTITRTDRRKEKMRREMWNKVELG